MERAYHRWLSPALGRPAELLVFGHRGTPMLVFPTARGRFYEYEDHGMVAALRGPIEQGVIQLYCVDSIDHESWLCERISPAARIARHSTWERYILDEVLPFIYSQNPDPGLIVHGCSFGATHAVLFGLRHPTRVRRIIACSGVYDVGRWLGDYHGDDRYFHEPLAFISGLQEDVTARELRRLDIVLAVGRDDSVNASNAQLSDALWGKGIWHALRWWDGQAHDWPYWQQMIQLYIGGAR